MRLALLLVALTQLGVCRSSSPTEPPPVTPETNANPNGGSRFDHPVVVLHPRTGPELVVHVEVARTPAVRERGLMYRRDMAEDHGMIFVFPQAEHNVFWMHNTYIPLDMIFIREDRTILGIVKNATPETDSSREVPGMSKWVLEVTGGYSDRHHLASGDRVEMFNVGPAYE